MPEKETQRHTLPAALSSWRPSVPLKYSPPAEASTSNFLRSSYENAFWQKCKWVKGWFRILEHEQVGGGEEGRWSKLGVMCKMAGTKMCKMGAQPWNRLRCTSSSSLTSVQCICASSRRLWPVCWPPIAHWYLHPKIIIWPLGTNLSFFYRRHYHWILYLADYEGSAITQNELRSGYIFISCYNFFGSINKGYGPVRVSLNTSYRFKGHL